MYQVEVKKQLVAYRFPPSDGWNVTIDLDSMELGIGGQHPEGKREIAEQCRVWLQEQGVRIGAHPTYQRADLVAVHSTNGTFVLEVEGLSARQHGQSMYSALGQILLAMTRFDDEIAYGIAVPDSVAWERQLCRIPAYVRQRRKLSLLLVSSDGVRTLEPEGEL